MGRGPEGNRAKFKRPPKTTDQGKVNVREGKGRKQRGCSGVERETRTKLGCLRRIVVEEK